MYAEVTSRTQLPRLYELKNLLTDPSHPDAYFQNFEDNLQDESCFKTYNLWEEELRVSILTPGSFLRAKRHVICNVTLKRAAAGTNFSTPWAKPSPIITLKTAVGCPKVRFIPESTGKTPDLEGMVDGARALCEVKTINISDNEIAARSQLVVRDVVNKLSGGFFESLTRTSRKPRTSYRLSIPKTSHSTLLTSLSAQTIGFPPIGKTTFSKSRSICGITLRELRCSRT